MNSQMKGDEYLLAADEPVTDEIRELKDLDLVLIGGGHGDVQF